MVLYIHGIGEHPPKDETKRMWDLALFGKPMGDSTSMAYWSDILHGPSPGRRTRSLRQEAKQTKEDLGLDEILDGAKVPKSKRKDAGHLIEALAAAMASGAGGSPPSRRGPSAKFLPLPGGLRRRVAAAFLKRFLKDVAAYFFQTGKRKRIQERLRSQLKKQREEFVLVSHSLGTVVAYEILSERKDKRPDCSLFVTMGSPLGIQEVQDVLRDFGSNLSFPPQVQVWHNYADRLDPVALDRKLSNDFEIPRNRRIVDHLVINERTTDIRRFNPHSAEGYLSDRNVRSVVHHEAGFDSSGRFVVARDVAEEFADPQERMPLLIEVLEPGYPAVDEDRKECRGRESTQEDLLSNLSGRISWLKEEVQEIAVRQTLGPDPDDKQAEKCRQEIGAMALRKYVAANLTPDEVAAISAQHAELNVYAVWRNSRKSKLLDRSHIPLKADAGRISYNATGEGITWAVLDTGVRWDHSHFKNQKSILEVWDCTTFDDSPQPMFLNGRTRRGYDARTADLDGHGSHVCGIIAGAGQLGDRVLQGVAPQAKLVVYKVLDDDGFGMDAWIIKAIDHIFDQNQSAVSGLKIHGVNLSLGGPFDATVYGCGFSPICKELRDIWRQGTLVCVAAGNEGQIQVLTDDGAGFDLNTQVSIGDPANLQDCVAVGSVHADKPNLYGVSWFSSRGPTADGRPKPDVVAPGERIVSCSSRGTELYQTSSGTSMACPHVSGLLAAFLSVRNEFAGRPDEVKQILLENCNDLGRHVNHQGRGLPNLMKMLSNS